MLISLLRIYGTHFLPFLESLLVLPAYPASAAAATLPTVILQTHQLALNPKLFPIPAAI